jgi:hypothetical protein
MLESVTMTEALPHAAGSIAQATPFVEYGVVGALIVVIFYLLKHITSQGGKFTAAISEATKSHEATSGRLATAVDGMSEAIGKLAHANELQAVTTRAALVAALGPSGDRKMVSIEQAVHRALAGKGLT